MTDEELLKKYIAKDLQQEALLKLKSGYPVQYIIGNVDFYDSIIEVNENVLIPRFETEYLVDSTIKYVKKLFNSKIQILEIGTGSGCISINLKKNLNSDITAIDINAKAVELANTNAVKNNVSINNVVCDVHEFKTNQKFDLIISNPPYVKCGSEVSANIKYEPSNAIYAPDDGIHFYKVILSKFKDNLKQKYLVAFEIGDNEGLIIKELAKELLPKCHVKIEKDLNKYERYVFISSDPI